MPKKATKKPHAKQVALPLPPPAKVTRPAQLHFNQEVTLKSDPTFRGYVFGLRPDGSEYMVSIKTPGRTGKRGCKFFKVADVVAYVEGGRR